MQMIFDEKQLRADIRLLKRKGVKKDAAENIAQFKQAVEYAVYFQENFGFIEEEDASEIINQSLDCANSMLEDVWWEVSPIFETEKVAVAAVAA